jgi:Tfp pilus assembly protein PilF
MKTRSIALALVFAFAPVALGTPAFAQPAADDPTIKEARARFQEGVGFYDKGEFEKARAAFLQAYSLRKHPAVLLNLAQSSLRSGHALEAAQYFQRYLRDSKDLSPAQRADAERGLSEARQKLGRIEIVAAAGSMLMIDGEGVGTAPLADPVDVEPGAHKVKAGNEEQSITTVAGQKSTAKFGAGGGAPAPVPLPLPPPPTPTSNTPATPQPPPTDSGTAGSTAAPPPTGADNAGTAQPKKSLLAPPATMVPVYVGGMVALVGAGIAIGVGVIAKSSAQNSADSVASEIRKNGGHGPTATTPGSCGSTITADVTKFGKACAALADDNNKVDTDALVGNIGLAIGVAGAAFAVGWYLFAPKKSAEPTTGTWKAPKITPILGTQQNGLSLSGEF